MEIGIAGAGIGGLTAAAALASQGHRVQVFDKFDAPRPVGSGLVVQPVGQDVLARIGALDPAMQAGQRIRRMIGHEARRGRKVLDVFYDKRHGQRFGLAIHRAALFDAVLAAAQTAGAEIIAGHQVTGASSGPKRRLQFETGESRPFDLVIDAAGAGSPLSPLEARALHYGAIWGTVSWVDVPGLSLTELRQKYAAAHHMVGVLPVGRVPGREGDHAAIFWSLTPERLTQWQAAPLDDWRIEVEALWPEFLPYAEQIHSHDQMTPAFYSHGTLRHPVSEGLAHIGDAAHRASPQLGQGANMALLDAWALAEALRTSNSIEDALPRYAKARRWHLWIYQSMSALFTPMYQSDSNSLPLLRDHLLAPMTALPPVQAILSRLVCGDLLPPMRQGLQL